MRTPRLQPDGTYLLTLTKGVEARLCAIGAAVAGTYKWYVNSAGYATRDVGKRGARERIYLHVAIAEHLGLPTEHEIDHVNENKSDCRAENLRPATKSQNMCNRGAQKNNTSGYKGVTWNTQCDKWMMQIQANGKRRSSLHATKEEAAEAYAKAAAELHGDFHRLR